MANDTHGLCVCVCVCVYVYVYVYVFVFVFVFVSGDESEEFSPNCIDFYLSKTSHNTR